MASITGALAILRSLKANGVDYVFANAGTDFTALIEAWSSEEIGVSVPEPVLAAHESAAVAMAHGYYLATGKPQAVMVHVNVGLANAVMGLINAHSDDIPLIMMSGRTPLTEHQRMGARRTPIQYGQEQFDQTAMVRELVKWDYELRYAENAPALVSRACAVAMSEPHGAVYLSLPSEPLAEEMPEPESFAPVQVAASPARPDPAAFSRAAEWIEAAERPLIIVQRGDAEGRLSKALCAMAERHAIAVAEVFPTRNVMPADHGSLVGPDLRAHFAEVDAVLVIDAGVAWIERVARPRDEAKVIHIGADPLFTRMPVRSYRTSLAVAGNPAACVEDLAQALDTLGNEPDADRRQWLTEKNAAFRARIDGVIRDSGSKGITKEQVAAALAEVLGVDGIIVNERGAPAPYYAPPAANSYFGNTHAGGLGWSLPAALGVQFADPSRLVACVIGDGGYMFANPTVCHQIAAAQNLPLLAVVVNNHSWDAVRRQTLAVYPDGAAARANSMILTDLEPLPDFSATAAAAGAWSRRVEAPADLVPALREAVEVICTEKRQVLLDILVEKERT